MIVQRPLVGFRNWRADDDGRLWPVNWPTTVETPPSYYAWTRDPAEAECPSPSICAGLLSEDHDCGLHAYATVRPYGGGHIHGAVVAWGRVLIQEAGFRAQYARPVALLEHGAYPVSYDPARTRERQIAAVAERYGLPVLDREELAFYASWHGDPLAHPVLAAGRSYLPTEAEVGGGE